MGGPLTAAPAQARRRVGHALVGGARTAVLAAWLAYLLISGAPNLELEVFPATVAFHAVLGGAAILYLLYLSFERRLPRRTPLDLAILVLLLAYAAATAASLSWRVSLESTLLVLGALVVFYVVADGPFTLANGRRAFVLAVVAAAAYGLYVVGRDYWDWLRFARAVDGDLGWSDLAPPTVPRIHDVGDHPNVLAMALTLGAPFLIVSVYTGRALAARLASGAGLLLVAAALFFTLSRAAWVAAGIGGILAVGGIVVLERRPLEETTSRLGTLWARFAPAALTFGAAFLAAAVFVLALRWDARPQWLFRGSLSPRLDALAAGGEMFRDHPLLGTGPGLYAFLYNEYSGAYPVHSIHSHNGFLQAAVDLGLPGIAFMAVGGLSMGFLLVRGYRRADRQERLVLLAAGAALGGFLVHSLADTPNVWKTSLVALAAVAAIAVRGAAPPGDRLPVEVPPPRRIWRRWWPVLPPATVVVALVALLFFWTNLDGAHLYYARGLQRANDGLWAEAVAETRQAVDRDPDFALYHLQLGLEETMVFLDGGPPVLLDQAIGHLERGVALDPWSAIGHTNLARAYALAGRREEALREVEDARRRAGQDLAVALATAGILEDLRLDEEAIDAYAAALSLDASLAGSPFWSASPFRRAFYSEMLARSALGLNPCLVGDDALLSGETARTMDLDEAAENCRLFILSQPDNASARLGLAYILMAQGRLQEALPILQDAVSLHPDDGPARRALGRYYELAGDRERARHEWLLAGQLDDPQALVLLGDSYPPGQVPPEAIARAQEVLPLAGASVTIGGVQRYLLGILYYRVRYGRESPFVILIPGDWQEAVGSPFAALSEALDRWQREAGGRAGR